MSDNQTAAPVKKPYVSKVGLLKRQRAAMPKPINQDKRARRVVDPMLHEDLYGYHVESALGSGLHGRCYLASKIGKRSEEICLKVVNDPEHAKNEAKHLQMAKDLKIVPNLIFAGVFKGESVIGMKLAHDSIGTYFSAIDWISPHKFDDETTLRVLLQCLDGLKQIHALGIVHMDIKADNILVTPPYGCSRDVSLQIADFGMSTRVEAVDGKIQVVEGQPEYFIREMVHSSPTVHLRGGVHGFLEDLHQMAFLGLKMSGFELSSIKTIAGRLDFKKKILSRPAENMPERTEWMAPFFEELKNQNPVDINYDALKMALRSLAPPSFKKELRLRKHEQTMYLE